MKASVFGLKVLKMKAIDKRKKARYGLSHSGFTLVEVLLALAISGIVGIALYGVYNMFFRQSNIQDMVLEAQQNARAALNIMERELLNAGYFVGSEEALSEATATSIEFVYTDPSDTTVSTTSGKRLKVRYATITESGVTYLTRKEVNITDGITGSTRKIIDYVSSFTITYYDIDGNTIATPITSTDDRKDVRFVTIELTTRTKENIPGEASPETFTLRTNLRLRNLGIGLTAADATPPSAPTSVEARDTGICGRLKVKWTESPEGDVDGYRIYYGTSPGSYPGIINVPLAILTGSTYDCSRSGSSITCTIYPTSVPLVHTPSDGTSVTTYYFALKAYDKNMNPSAFSVEVSGASGTDTLSGSNTSFASGANDSTVNPVKSGLVGSITGADGPANNQVQLSWPLYDLDTNPGVEKLRIYRSDTDFTYPIDVSKFVSEVNPTETGYLDTTPDILGCKVYYYAIAPVNCDTTLVPDTDPVEYGNDSKYVAADYSETSGDGTGPESDSPAGSDTAPPDTDLPDAPLIGVRAGWKRVAVSLAQSSNADLDQTCVYVNQGLDYPELLTDTATYPLDNGCYQIGPTTPVARLIPNSDGIFTTSELPQAQTTSFWHNDWNTVLPDGVEPNLLESGTYSYRAVAFDLCENGSVVTQAQDTTNLCGEDPKVEDFPTNAFDHPKPPAVTGASAACCDEIVSCCEVEPPGVVLSWTEVSSNTSFPSAPTNPYDLAGYRIFRSTSAVDWSGALLLNPAAPVWGSQFIDTTISDGATYYYRIVTVDCPYERLNPVAATIRADMISNYLHSTIVGPVKPGMLDRDEKCPGVGACTKDDHREVLTGVDINQPGGNGTGVSTPSASFTHDTVTMFFDNTSGGILTIDSASVSWINSAAELEEIIIGGGRSGKGAQSTTVTAVPGSADPPFSRSITGK
jgi:type IV pilus assembly protein PilW